ncbi:MAG: hypothetical protein J5883_09100 [Clostridiales bacterium]|nr:hypothetical protein [Clostridiales bacterium]
MSFYVRGTDCGVNSCVLPNILLGMIQETADKGATDTGFDRNYLYGLGACWIVLRMRLHIIRLPKWRETITIRTWSTGVDRISFDREYEIFGEDGGLIGYCTSIWILADINTHRPLIPGKIEGLAPTISQSDRLVYGSKCPKTSMPDRSEFTGDPVIIKYADYSELDHNHHVNNSRYLAWAYDAMSKYGIDLEKAEDIMISYFSEVKAGEKVEIHILEEKEQNTCKIYGFRGEGDKVFSVEINLSV